ncbi:DUF2812 domain-containing protein [Clostridium gasigenes]|uniref:DUF2812 domain-containing protein n=1 Tax=Clostridium gasigenes TaxID=94869 RepID=UPI001C0AA91A|nr:DUF2812 domain-containing protein [Clostridium gasigenes]
MSDLKRVFKLFYIFDIHKEEAWLNEMARMGLHFKSVKLVGLYTFKKGKCEDGVYRIDFKEKIYDKEEYYKLYREYGFEYISKMRYFNYFKYTGEKENYKSVELYNNPTEELKWLKKYHYLILGCFVLELVILVNMIMEKINDKATHIFPILLIGLICILILFTTTKFSLSINRLKKIVKKTGEVEY